MIVINHNSLSSSSEEEKINLLTSLTGHYKPNNSNLADNNEISNNPSHCEYLSHRRVLNSSILSLIMGLTLSQITAIRSKFSLYSQYKQGVNLLEFIQIIITSLHTVPMDNLLLIESLYELFDTMDLDSSGLLEFEEFLSCIVFIGLSAVDQLVLSNISHYRAGPTVSVTSTPGNKFLKYLPEKCSLLMYDIQPFQLYLLDLQLQHKTQLKCTQNSILALEYITNFGDENHSTSNSNVLSSAKLNNLADQSLQAKHKLRLDRSAEIQQFYKESLEMTGVKQAAKRIEKNSSLQRDNTVSNSFVRVVDSWTGESYQTVQQRAGPGSRFNLNDILLTATAQYLSLFECIAPVATLNDSSHPGSHLKPRLSDAKKLSSPYVKLYWCNQLALLFAGNEAGEIHSWKIVNAVILTTAAQFTNNWNNLGSAKIHNSMINAIPLSSSANSSKSVLGHSSSSMSFSSSTTCKLLFQAKFAGHADAITAIQTIPNQFYLLSSSIDATIRMWQLSGSCLRVFAAHTAGIVELSYSAEFRFFASAGLDHDIHIWSPFSSKPVFSLTQHNYPLCGVRFIPQTSQIISADNEGIIRIWYTAKEHAAVITSLSLLTNVCCVVVVV
jgi:WD40 repeat protein